MQMKVANLRCNGDRAPAIDICMQFDESISSYNEKNISISPLDSFKNSDNRLNLEDQVADIFQRAKSGEPFGTKDDVNALIDKLCDHIYRKLLEESWCPCARHSKINQSLTENPEDLKIDDKEGYMQCIRKKVLEILSDYLATFKNQLFSTYGSEPTDQLDIKGEDKDTVSGCVSGEPSTYTMANTDSFLSRVEKNSGIHSVTNTNVCGNSLSDISINDWVSVGRCLSRENYFDQSPRLSVSASPATSRWGADLEAEGSFGAYRKTQSCTAAATPTEVRTEHEDTRRRPQGAHCVTSEVEQNTMSRETFKKTSNKKLIKKSRGSMEKQQQKIESSPLLTETEDFHPDHFRYDKDSVKGTSVGPKAGAANGDGNKGTSSLEKPEVPMNYIGGVPTHLYYNRGSADSVSRKRASNRSPAMVKMRRKAMSVVGFLKLLRKPL
ncbi:uncharacterized protein LOC121432155 [Lytechinus variegatus]|uniref:uncharacterized protein LOC121432155 n=1 Tax=Lytechinus variegatus TaxID=7654 RepID=UPI001BB2144D|nr:uncharacterized protein LOC121432155 [Lytechinus variegatus]